MKTLKEVVPMFWNEEEVKNLVQNNRVNKTNLHKALAKYLRKIVDISDGKLNFDDYKAYTNGVSLEHMDDKFEQLSFFLKMENTNLQAISSRTSQAKVDARRAIFEANGSEISPFQRYKVFDVSNDSS